MKINIIVTIVVLFISACGGGDGSDSNAGIIDELQSLQADDIVNFSDREDCTLIDFIEVSGDGLSYVWEIPYYNPSIDVYNPAFYLSSLVYNQVNDVYFLDSSDSETNLEWTLVGGDMEDSLNPRIGASSIAIKENFEANEIIGRVLVTYDENSNDEFVKLNSLIYYFNPDKILDTKEIECERIADDEYLEFRMVKNKCIWVDKDMRSIQGKPFCVDSQRIFK